MDILGMNTGSTANNSDLPITNAKQGFKDFFTKGISLHELKDGAYPAKLKSATFVDADAKNPNSKPYVRLELQLPDRIIIDNRFETGFGLFEQHIKKQLNIQDQDIAIPDLMLMLTTTEFKVWISHVIIEGKSYRNINYLAPIPTETPSGTSTEMGTGDF